MGRLAGKSVPKWTCKYGGYYSVDGILKTFTHSHDLVPEWVKEGMRQLLKSISV